MTEQTVTTAPADENWDAEREALEAKIKESVWGRAQTQGWISSNPAKLSKRGAADALEHIIGMAQGFELADHPRKKWMLMQAFLCSVRGVEERFPRPASTL